MVYSTAVDASAQVPGIAANKGAARAFVQRLVLQTVLDVLESQGRSALLPDAIILSILSQLSVNITYEPIECPGISLTRREMVGGPQGEPSRRCIIVGNTVTGICSAIGQNAGSCMMPVPDRVEITSVPTNYTTISGTFTTTNTVMANWSKMMWQNVVNRAVRMLAAGPFGSHFSSATGSVRGNRK
ncbi:hypothetical protein KIN20_014929 [Parelaphostrongylus tenuis]|uniref:Uncharacterized protein n=1 Tax=Parelaphostrongylus tenuis TaxID=148309 RepID=A0AAD5MIT0_PARTN|nr:hypothetical protein KIN20_014929 [Parelaphostrongylus tenuis]